MEIAIITNRKVDTTFSGEQCLLVRTIVSTYKEGNIKRFTLVTERANYYDVGGVPTLKIINEKDTAVEVDRTKEEIDGLFELIKSQFNFDNGLFNFENKVEQMGLLLGTQQDLPWGTNPEDWQLLPE